MGFTLVAPRLSPGTAAASFNLSEAQSPHLQNEARDWHVLFLGLLRASNKIRCTKNTSYVEVVTKVPCHGHWQDDARFWDSPDAGMVEEIQKFPEIPCRHVQDTPEGQ